MCIRDRYVLVVPLFKRDSDKYRNMIMAAGGKIVYECPPNTMGFIPDHYWKGSLRNKADNIRHAIGIVMFENTSARKSKPYDESVLQRRIRAWHNYHQAHRRRTNGDNEEIPPPESGGEPTVPIFMRVWEEKKGMWATRAKGTGLSKDSKQSCWFKTLKWNPILGALGYLPTEMKNALKEVGCSSAIADDKCKRLSQTLLAGAKEIWSLRNKAQLLAESDCGINAMEKRDKGAAREFRQEVRGLSAKQRAAIREMESAGKSFIPPIVDAVGRVIARYCVETDCQRETAVRGRYCPSCDARLPSRARIPWRPMSRVEEELWGDENDYWKARSLEVIRSMTVSIEEKRRKASELGWFRQAELNDLLRRAWVVQGEAGEGRVAAADRARSRVIAHDCRERQDPMRTPQIGKTRNRYEGTSPPHTRTANAGRAQGTTDENGGEDTGRLRRRRLWLAGLGTGLMGILVKKPRRE